MIKRKNDAGWVTVKKLREDIDRNETNRLVNKAIYYSRQLKIWAWVAVLFSTTQTIVCAIVFWYIHVINSEIPYETTCDLFLISLLTGLSQPFIFLRVVYLIVRLIIHSSESSGVPSKQVVVRYTFALAVMVGLYVYSGYVLRMFDYLD